MQPIQLPLRSPKRKARSTNTDIERISFEPLPSSQQHKRRSVHIQEKTNPVSTTVALQPAEPDGKSSRASNLDKYFMLGAIDCSESVGTHERALKALKNVYDPIIFSDDKPYNITPLAPFLFQPRLPPTLPQSILGLSFNTIIRRYKKISVIIDNYLRWHGLSCFGWWTKQDQQNPLFKKALIERPPIPPNVLQTSFYTVLLGAPVLSHVIERYHRDVGYDYFGFYYKDPRVKLIESEPTSDTDHDGSSGDHLGSD